MVRSMSALLTAAAVTVVSLSSMTFVQAPISTRSGSVGRMRMRGAAAEEPHVEAPESSGSQAALGALVSFGLLAGLLAPGGAVAVMDVVFSRSVQSTTMTEGIDSDKASIQEVKTTYVSVNGNLNHQFPTEINGVGDSREAFESTSGNVNRVQNSFLQTNELDWQKICYPGIC